MHFLPEAEVGTGIDKLDQEDRGTETQDISITSAWSVLSEIEEELADPKPIRVEEWCTKAEILVKIRRRVVKAEPERMCAVFQNLITRAMLEMRRMAVSDELELITALNCWRRIEQLMLDGDCSLGHFRRDSPEIEDILTLAIRVAQALRSEEFLRRIAYFRYPSERCGKSAEERARMLVKYKNWNR